jgi:tetratricopeptide (TPR) repeat protein
VSQTGVAQRASIHAVSTNNLATVLEGQGKYEQAEETLRQALGLYETVLGKEHPNTLTSMSNLAGVMSDQGKYEQAEEMRRQALRLRETVIVCGGVTGRKCGLRFLTLIGDIGW